MIGPLTRRVVAVLAGLVAGGVACGAGGDGELGRRGMLGVQIGPGGGGGGVVVAGVLPGGAAAEAGLLAGDVIVSVDGEAVGGAGLSDVLSGVRAGQRLLVVYEREGVRREAVVELSPPDATAVAGSEVEYGSVAMGDDVRLRTILSLPEGADGPVPVVYLLQGITCASVDFPAGGGGSLRMQLDGFGEAGFATFRVDKPGTGDSEGGPCSELGFDRELAGYRAGLEMLMEEGRVDGERVYLYGVSMGGIMAPLLAAEREVAGVAVWGTGISNWMEYLIENRRRQGVLFGQDRAAVEALTPLFNRFVAEMCVQGRTPEEMAREDGAFGAALGIGEGATGYAGRHARFHRELASRDLFAAWASFDAPVLVMHGEFDWVAFREESELIVSFVNGIGVGRAEFISVPGADHGFTTHGSLEASVANAFRGARDAGVGDIVLGWVESL